ncbi:hypothetical protein H2248_000260 [Termitomyces sp. 'cryptogamus']|nr:hypothetical protein H2248_000260 [Termitomyces sp. 'cryptogamus']
MHHLRRFSNGTPNQWLRSPLEIYKPGVRLTIALPTHKGSMEVQIVKAYTPFTNSVVLLVKAELCVWNLPSRFILKLADRRVAENWDSDSERDYQASIRSHVEASAIPTDCEEPHPWVHMMKY